MPTAQLNGFRCHYLDSEAEESAGRASGGRPALVLLHGLGSSARDWEAQFRAFRLHFRVIAPDLRGFGASERRGPYAIHGFAADVRALLGQLGVERFFLLGYSMGGAVALQMALDHPHCVPRLIVSNSVPSFRPQSRAHWTMILYRMFMMTLVGPRIMGRIQMARMFPRPDQAELRAKNQQRAARNSRWAYLGALRALIGWSVVERLRELPMPVLVLAAEDDYFSHAEIVRFAHALPRGRLRVFPRTRHGLPQEAPEDYNRAVLKFLLQERPGG